MSPCCPQQPPSVLWLLLLQSRNLPSSHPGGTSAAQHERQDPAARRGACSSQHGTVPSRLAEGLRGAMALSPKSFGRHGTRFFPTLCQPAGFKPVHTHWSGITDQVPGSSQLQRANLPPLQPHRHPWLALQPQLPDLAPEADPQSGVLSPEGTPSSLCQHQCHHALCIVLHRSEQGIIGKKGRAQRAVNSRPPAQTWWDPWFRGTKKALPGPTRQVQGACTSCSTCGTAEGLFMLSGLQNKSTVPSLLGQHQAWELGPSCILCPFASHQRLLQDFLRGNCPDTGAGSEVRPSQGRAAEAKGKRWLIPWAAQSFPVCGVCWGA